MTERAKQLDNDDKSCKAFRLASIEARGEKAGALLRDLSPALRMRFLPADEA